MVKTLIQTLFISLLMLPLFANEKVAMTDNALSQAHILLKTMNMQETYKRMIEKITMMQIQQNPQLIVIKPTIHDFFEKYMGWSVLKEDMAKVYASYFTEEELRKMNQFYQTEVGKKSVKLMPYLASKGARVGQQKLLSHMHELQTMIEKALKEEKAK